MSGLSTAFYLACIALAADHGEPLPKGIITCSVGDWKLALNTGDEAVEYHGSMLPPVTVYAWNTVYVGFALFGPAGGIIGGVPEDRFIQDMNAAGIVVPEGGTDD